MTASERSRRKVKRSEKIGGLRKHVGSLGFAGLAKLSRQRAISHGAAIDPPCVAAQRLLPSADFSDGADRAAPPLFAV
jgi:hypothetical protein